MGTTRNKVNNIYKIYKYIWPYTILIILFVMFLHVRKSTKEEIELLTKEGIYTKAVYYEKYDRIGKADIYKYEFYINGIRYDNTYETRDYVNTNDSVEIVYYKYNPEINALAEYYRNLEKKLNK